MCYIMLYCKYSFLSLELLKIFLGTQAFELVAIALELGIDNTVLVFLTHNFTISYIRLSLYYTINLFKKTLT